LKPVRQPGRELPNHRVVRAGRRRCGREQQEGAGQNLRAEESDERRHRFLFRMVGYSASERSSRAEAASKVPAPPFMGGFFWSQESYHERPARYDYYTFRRGLPANFLGPRGRVLGDWRPGVVVAGGSFFGVQELHRLGSVLWAHREHIARSEERR